LITLTSGSYFSSASSSFVLNLNLSNGFIFIGVSITIGAAITVSSKALF
jgi:hypothetical protein